MDDAEKRPARAKKKLWILLPVVLLVILSLAFLATRALHWHQELEKTRLLTLVDREHPVEDDYNVEFTLLGNGQMVDSRCVDDLEEMLDACVRAGGQPELGSSFRTWGAQERLYNDALEALTGEGWSRGEAEARLSGRIALPGYSEHQLGLAVDIREQGELPEEQQADTPTVRWLTDNSWRYGFILRYPAEKSGVTGMDYHPCHYRYVGREAAEQIHELGLSLEEYLQLFYS